MAFSSVCFPFALTFFMSLLVHMTGYASQPESFFLISLVEIILCSLVIIPSFMADETTWKKRLIAMLKFLGILLILLGIPLGISFLTSWLFKFNFYLIFEITLFISATVLSIVF